MKYFSCYEVTNEKGYLLNPILIEHFKTGVKKLSYAVELHLFQRDLNCSQEEAGHLL